MEKMIDLKDLLKHEVQDLFSAEEQIIAAMPAMIEKVTNPTLKKALTEHLRITEKQRTRLEKVQKLLGKNGENSEENKGLFSRLFGGSSHKCKGMEGLITEGEKVMGEDMNPEVMDAAIISCSQKIEHYEICGYGTARAFARELNLRDVASLLEETLNEEYEADDILTNLAVGGGLNQEAETAGRSTSSNKNSGNRSGGSKGAAKKSASKSASKSSSSKGASKSTTSKGGSKTASKKSAPAKKSASKGSSKGAGKSKGGGKTTSKAASKSRR